MARILAKNTKPEIKIRRLLYSLGYRFRIHKKDLPGKPDIVLLKYKAVIFVHGCFWHLHDGCRDGTIPKTRTKYWTEKLTTNQERDIRNIKKLRRAGWKVLRFWECEIERKIAKIQQKILRTFTQNQ